MRGLLTKVGVLVITALLALYLTLTVRQSWLLITGADAVGVGIGLALIVLPALAAAFIARELVFGMQAQRLTDRMIDDDALPVDDLPRSPSGRVERAAADEDFPRWKAAVEAAPDDWRAWYRLGIAYRASSDTRRARAAVRTAIKLERDDRRAPADA
ncbi:hypothetical protein GCM10011490_05710 [Pseudoclavibacter endophyticus]|uniref:Uncharacterized protein n=1 Tax=Pseudoclavibacter endophyticus TaxID=1778590 RepID=A0A6H9WG89_9MICO|nr:hypothetical protein [Pseudoclavibacter endophyticus]KAB1649932.1 hypothetical protein F8O04_06825 [Pseudoclavibacter endophyticus]GGA58630.1 hypothetical protein GCM10011490_05710 [Pseudoclavibacter endophyticus]